MHFLHPPMHEKRCNCWWSRGYLLLQSVVSAGELHTFKWLESVLFFWNLRQYLTWIFCLRILFGLNGQVVYGIFEMFSSKLTADHSYFEFVIHKKTLIWDGLYDDQFIVFVKSNERIICFSLITVNKLHRKVINMNICTIVVLC